MAWFKVDDAFFASRKVIRIPRLMRFEAVGLWLIAGTWCAQNETDGLIEVHELDELGGSDRVAEQLVRVGLWEEIVEGDSLVGYRFHDWEKYQPTRAELEEKRAADAARQRERRAKERPDVVTLDALEVSERSPIGRSAESRPPDPTRPVSKKRTSSPVGEGGRSFDEFWSVYPRKVGKEAARKAFARAAKNLSQSSVIIAGARRFAADPNLPEKKFIPHPTTWLNRGGWEDEVLPADGPVQLALVQPKSSLTEAQILWLSARGVSREEFEERKDEPGWLDMVKRIEAREAVRG